MFMKWNCWITEAAVERPENRETKKTSDESLERSSDENVIT